jgi:hypothetical protein
MCDRVFRCHVNSEHSTFDLFWKCDSPTIVLIVNTYLHVMLAEWSGVKLPRYNNSLVYVLAKGNSLHSTRAAGMITTFHTPLLFQSLLLPTFLSDSHDKHLLPIRLSQVDPACI